MRAEGWRTAGLTAVVGFRGAGHGGMSTTFRACVLAASPNAS